DSLTAACWSIVFVETAATPQATGRQVTYITRLGVKVYVIPPGLPRDGEITAVQVRPAVRRPPAAGSGRELVVLFRNTGGVPLWPHGRAEFPLLPGAVRRVTVAVPALPRGRYVALALVDYGGADIAGGQAELEVP